MSGMSYILKPATKFRAYLVGAIVGATDVGARFNCSNSSSASISSCISINAAFSCDLSNNPPFDSLPLEELLVVLDSAALDCFASDPLVPSYESFASLYLTTPLPVDPGLLSITSILFV